MKRYYNTNQAHGQVLYTAQKKAMGQQERILDYFRSFPTHSFTPSKIQELVFSHRVPITSVRRAISNLTDAGKLVKLGSTAVGPYGAKEHLWTAPAAEQMELF